MTAPAPTHTFGASRLLALPDGRRLHHMVAGAGQPTVVFESGMGFSRSIWGLVQPAVAERTRTVVYDRAGLGRSDRDPRPRTLARIGDDLRALLAALGPGPFVLVGHSWGGPIVRTAAAALGPEVVRGVVLVDQTDERCDLFLGPAMERRVAFGNRMTPLLARTGLYRAFGAIPGRRQPADVVADHRREDFTVAAAAAMGAELAAFPDEIRALREAPPALDPIAVTVLSGTKRTRFDRAGRRQVVAAHRATAEEASHGRFVPAPRSAHLIMFSEPRLIVDEVLRLLDR
ncbi:alpha/beta fold hydrolase [Patulibacter defluvii]|uniref:alpha/beta fold hydrolase n=1 Tax=Patulibacter defluvii TaxID=3095358 RepID=UPI002A74F843|nr:alpha/beta hydrolase [Patulibacter sp. DM4]